MVVRRNESRRRRVGVAGDSTLAGTDPVVPSIHPNWKSSRDARAYSFGADRRNQLKTTDLIPKRWTSFSFVVLLLLASIGLLNLLFNYASSWESQIGVSEVAALGLTGRGTIASWFSSFLLIITGLASLQIYALRQHRRDDYRGTYRLWIWMAALLMFASLNCVVDLAAIVSSLICSWTAFSFQGKSWLPVAIKLVVLSTLIARGLYEVRASRGSFALVLFVWVAYSTAAIIQIPAVRPALVNLGQEATLGNCLLFGTAALLMAELVYARFIFLQAHGLIQQRVAKPKIAKSKTSKPKVTKSKISKPKVADPEAAKPAKAKKKSQVSKVKSGRQAGNRGGFIQQVGDRRCELDNPTANCRKACSQLDKNVGSGKRPQVKSPDTSRRGRRRWSNQTQQVRGAPAAERSQAATCRLILRRQPRGTLRIESKRVGEENELVHRGRDDETFS